MPNGRILAVDDQRYFRELLESFCVEAGFEVQTAASAEEALRILDHAAFDVVLTDLVMPGMDGTQLVQRVKQRDPDQDIIVVTGVVDVKTAVEAMKIGAAEYLLKPFDRATLASSLESVIQRRRLENEHARLLAENIEFLGERTLLERATSLFSSLAPEPLADRILDGLCIETGAQGGVLWVAGASEPEPLRLAAGRGLVRVDEEPEMLPEEALPEALRAGGERAALLPFGSAEGGEDASLCVLLRRDDRVLGFARLTDKLGGDVFDPTDVASADKFAGFAERALSNALHVAALERGSLVDPDTGAYVFEYLQGAVRTEIEKANRHGRSFSLLQLDLGPLGGLRRRAGDAEFRRWLGDVADLLRTGLRGTDVLAARTRGCFLMLLPESDGLGAVALKHRLSEALADSGLVSGIEPPHRPDPAFVSATFPADGSQLEALLRVLAERGEQERRSPVRRLGLERLTLAECLEALLREGGRERPDVVEGVSRFLLAETARLPRERGVLFVAPGAPLAAAVREATASLRGAAPATEILVLAEGDRVPDAPVAWLKPPDAGDGAPLAPFLVRCGDGPAYACVRESEDARDAEQRTVRFFHTSDRSLVEHLAFRLQRELAVPQLS